MGQHIVCVCVCMLYVYVYVVCVRICCIPCRDVGRLQSTYIPSRDRYNSVLV
jgi:hypothetical protein